MSNPMEKKHGTLLNETAEINKRKQLAVLLCISTEKPKKNDLLAQNIKFPSTRCLWRPF